MRQRGESTGSAASECFRTDTRTAVCGSHRGARWWRDLEAPHQVEGDHAEQLPKAVGRIPHRRHAVEGAAALDDIFQEFYQLGNPERDRRQGLGLGLAIVKRVAALLGHEVTVRSRLGHGSCFAITVPLSQESPFSLPFPAMSVPGLELWKHRVLVLDDDHAILAAMEGLLKHWGCQVSTAASLEEAQEKITANTLPPELLIVDYRLPGEVSGLDAATALQTALGRRVPVLVITGDTAPDRPCEAQASSYPLLHKPVQPAKLRSMMRHLIGL